MLFLSLTNLWKLLDPHPRLQLHVLYVQALGVGGAAVGELHLHRHHVAVGAEGLSTEAVLHRQTLPCDPVQQLVVLQRAGWGDGLGAEEQTGHRHGDAVVLRYDTLDRVFIVNANRGKVLKRKCKAFTAGERTLSDRDSPSRSVTRLLDRKLLTGVT